LTQIVVITGAARGIGRATALAFAEAGDVVFLTDGGTDIDVCPYPLGTLEQLEDTAERCRRIGATAVTAAADVREPEQIAAALDRCRGELGSPDVLINNAGIVGPGGKLAHEFDEAEWSAMVDVDLSGVWRWAKAVLPDMVKRRSGAIVNVSSTAGLVAFPYFANYVAAKHGVVGLTRALALDYAPFAIRVNAVCPTSVRDDPRLDSGMLAGVAGMLELDLADYEALSLQQHPLGTLVDAEDVAAAVVWLASAAAKSITGAVIPIDAGFTVR
jgi:NAD(P)-dependent dehydrogenase (short-subunit alcohol dehydrogenase family)